MRAVWSFWSKPFLADRRSSWYSEWHHWLAWGLSLDTARTHYPETCLVTDDLGAEILIDQLGLPFEHVSTALNDLDHEDPGWWALGKLLAYRMQAEPFVHIDTDVFLWKPLAEDVCSAGVFAQNPEPLWLGNSCYRPGELERAIRFPESGWLPREWPWYVAKGPDLQAACCGIFGGRHVDFIQYYTDLAIRILTDDENRRQLSNLSEKPGHMILLEQFLLTACIEYHSQRKGSPFCDIDIAYVFPTIDDAFRPEHAAEAGFTHLASDVKRNGRIARHLEMRVRRELPEYYERCLAFLEPRGFEDAEIVHLD